MIARTDHLRRRGVQTVGIATPSGCCLAQLWNWHDECTFVQHGIQRCLNAAVSAGGQLGRTRRERVLR